MKRSRILIKELALSFLLCAILYLFYGTVIVLAAWPVIFVLCRRHMKKEALKQEKDRLNVQFRDMLISMTAAMRAGYSVENALKEAYKEMLITCEASSGICREMVIMLNQLKLGMTAEEVFAELAERSGIEDINTFASVFGIAKRSGGDMTRIISKTTSDISAKVDTRSEIAVVISSKRLELNIMLLMPAGIIVYMKLASGGLLDPLYKNAAGILIMTICLGLYALAWYLGQKITDIEV